MKNQNNRPQNPTQNSKASSKEYQAPIVRPAMQPAEEADPAKMIPINGFRQILDMLKVADPVFRESLLRRIAAKDARLAQSLIQGLRVS